MALYLHLMPRLVITTLLFTLCGMVLAEPVIAANTDTVEPEELRRLAAKADRDGKVRLIINLKLPGPGFRPEGTLAQQELRQQRKNIAEVREALISSLSGHDIEVYGVYGSIPSVALRADAAALQEMAVSPYVTGIREDEASGTHENDISAEQPEGNPTPAGVSAETD